MFHHGSKKEEKNEIRRKACNCRSTTNQPLASMEGSEVGRGLVLTGGDEEEKQRRGVVADEPHGVEAGGCLACDGHGALGAGLARVAPGACRGMLRGGMAHLSFCCTVNANGIFHLEYSI